MSKDESVLLRFTGSVLSRRVIDDYEWTPDNGHVCAVPLELAADLLTGKESGDWELAEKPKVAVLRKLGEMMGALPELIQTPGAEENEVTNG